MNYLISFDLNRPGQEYAPLIKTLEDMGAHKVQDSSWLLRSTLTAQEIRQQLPMDSNDVAEVFELASNGKHDCRPRSSAYLAGATSQPAADGILRTDAAKALTDSYEAREGPSKK
ncbi:hypothetical protein [Crenobacter cavernae]|uniref:CRISPR-associated protein Cas2 n=1 Tax=Crenobacter cavernae TaxID=2290923 RepID=A0ABY0FG35_9NEIS|nr:hypothetical protein [Crenobacter cavernae]RXZ45342.1 hypothetical protein EBB06_00525 [Crenobacter cavernae]